MQEPGLGQFPSSKLFGNNSICMSPVVGSQYRAATEAAKSLIDQLDSQRKQATPRCENLKIRHGN
jgi:hypothetical protein